MPRVKKVKNAELKKCRICTRSTRDENTLGPFRETDTVAAHYKCVLFSPVVPDKLDFDPNGIAGMSARFIRDEGRRAEPLICVYCKKRGANVGCCCDVGTDAVLKFCHRRYHVDCGYDKKASFTVSANCGSVSLCFEHRDTIEKKDDQPTDRVADESAHGSEYDLTDADGAVGGATPSAFETPENDRSNTDVVASPGENFTDGINRAIEIDLISDDESNAHGDADTTEKTGKIKEMDAIQDAINAFEMLENVGLDTDVVFSSEQPQAEEENRSFKMEKVAAALNETDGYYSEDSDVVVTAAYYECSVDGETSAHQDSVAIQEMESIETAVAASSTFETLENVHPHNNVVPSPEKPRTEEENQSFKIEDEAASFKENDYYFSEDSEVAITTAYYECSVDGETSAHQDSVAIQEMKSNQAASPEKPRIKEENHSLEMEQVAALLNNIDDSSSEGSDDDIAQDKN